MKLSFGGRGLDGFVILAWSGKTAWQCEVQHAVGPARFAIMPRFFLSGE